MSCLLFGAFLCPFKTVKFCQDERGNEVSCGPVTTIHHSLGSVLVSFKFSPMAFLEPTLDPAVIAWGPKDQVVQHVSSSRGALAYFPPLYMAAAWLSCLRLAHLRCVACISQSVCASIQMYIHADVRTSVHTTHCADHF